MGDLITVRMPGLARVVEVAITTATTLGGAWIASRFGWDNPSTGWLLICGSGVGWLYGAALHEYPYETIYGSSLSAALYGVFRMRERDRKAREGTIDTKN